MVHRHLAFDVVEARLPGGRGTSSPFLSWRIVKSRALVAVSCGVVILPSLLFAQEPPSLGPAPPPAASGASPIPSPDATKPADHPPTTAPSLSRDARIRELESKVERLSRALGELKAAQSPSAAQPTPAQVAPAPAAPVAEPDLDPLRGIVVTGYLQAQLENHEESEDQIRPGGGTLNQNRFLVRRGRVKIAREWEYSSVMMELDGNTTKGPSFSLWHAEASVLLRGGKPAPAPALVKLTGGIFDAPFGYELLESPRTRWFTERSVQSRAFFPSEPDLGARLSGQVGWLRYAFAFMNGNPLGEPTSFAGQDPNSHKDFVGRVGAVVPVDDFEVSGGVSVLNGQGFIKGTDATKNTLVWSDDNQDRKVQVDTEILPQPATAASPSRNFRHWAMGADLQTRLKTPAGWTTLYGEVQLGSNIDRGLFIVNPSVASQDTRELGYYIALTQEVSPYGAVGFRMDYYNPNADFLGFQSGKLVTVSQRIRTYSPMVALVVPGRARLVFQYDFIRDFLGRDVRGVPNDLANDAWTLRLQGEL